MSAVPAERADARPRSVSELRSRFRQGKTELLDHFREARATSASATRLLRALTKHVDQTLLFFRINDVPRFKKSFRAVIPSIATTGEVLAFNRLFKAMRTRLGSDPTQPPTPARALTP